MGEKRGTKALELWCRRITGGYPGVNVQNMTTSWRDGLAFCAMIHHFRPDLIEFSNLDKNDVYGNNELAFRIAEQHLGIPALLDAEDMASCNVPDRLSILTYLSQFYQNFASSSPGRLAVNRTSETVDDSIVSRSTSSKLKVPERPDIRRDLCVVCGFPVFLAEKLVIQHVVYHRTCFRCARCNNQLTVGNYYETEEGKFCCETCPDEEATFFAMQKYQTEALSTGECRKTENNATTDPKYQESLNIDEDAEQKLLDYNSVKSLAPTQYTIPDLIAQTSQLRVNFISNYLLSDGQGSQAAIDSRAKGNMETFGEGDTKLQADAMASVDSAFPMIGEKEDERESHSFPALLKPDSQDNEVVLADGSLMKDTIYDKLADMKGDQQKIVPPLYNASKSESVASVARRYDSEGLLSHDKEHKNAPKGLSLVQRRLRLFEGQSKQDRINTGEDKREDNKALRTMNEEDQLMTGIRIDDVVADMGTTGIQNQGDENAILRNHTSTDLESSLILRKNSSSKPNSLTVYAGSNDYDTLPTNRASNFNADQGKQNSSVVSISETSLPFSWKVSETPEIAHEEKYMQKGHASVDVAEGTDQAYTDTARTNIHQDYPDHLNPFASDEEGNAKDIATADTFTTAGNPAYDFSSKPSEQQQDENKEKGVTPLTQTARNDASGDKSKQKFMADVQSKRRLVAPQISLNPFWSDEDEDISDLRCRDASVSNRHVTKYNQESKTDGRQLDANYNNPFASAGALAGAELETSAESTFRKKKPAPSPPSTKELFSRHQHTSLISKSHSDSTRYHGSLAHSTPKMRKTRPAPPPPLPIDVPYNTTFDSSLNDGEHLIDEHGMDDNQDVWGDTKINKDEVNKSRRSLTHTPNEGSIVYKSIVDKSIHGKWKRKKGPAPCCPVPQRRKIKLISLKDVNLEMSKIELQQQGLEKQGVRLEQLIRNKCEPGPRTDDVSLGSDVEELILELFALVNEKNELFRRQAELILLRRQQRLEEEYADVEYQIRCLMSQHDCTKTDFDKEREDALIQRLIQIVEKRNEIVESLEMDRRREIEEDRSIHRQMGLFVAKNKSEISNNELGGYRPFKVKANKSKNKTKEKSKGVSNCKKDVDKDEDETELKIKRRIIKRKWF